jgi:hypothetical protein
LGGSCGLPLLLLLLLLSIDKERLNGPHDAASGRAKSLRFVSWNRLSRELDEISAPQQIAETAGSRMNVPGF